MAAFNRLRALLFMGIYNSLTPLLLLLDFSEISSHALREWSTGRQRARSTGHLSFTVCILLCRAINVHSRDPNDLTQFPLHSHSAPGSSCHTSSLPLSIATNFHLQPQSYDKVIETQDQAPTATLDIKWSFSRATTCSS